MALDTYAGLKASVASWMHRSNLTGDIPDFIMLTEKRIKALLKDRLQSLNATVSTVLGTAYASTPADLLKVRAMSIANVQSKITYVAPDQYNGEFSDQRSGSPYRYTIIGDKFYFGPVPDAVYSVSLTYEAEFLALSDTNTTNSLLDRWPNIYLFGALVEAADFSQNAPLKAIYEQKFLTAIDDANRLEWSSSGPMRMRTDTNTP